MTENSYTTIEGTIYSSQGVGVVRLKADFEHDRSAVWSAMSDTEHLAGWFGNVSGDLRVDGEFSAYVFSSEWEGHGRVDECKPEEGLVVTMWEEEGLEHTAAADLSAEEGRIILRVQVSGVPVEHAWAYASGWHEHLYDLGSYLDGQARSRKSSDARFDEFAASYREMPVIPLEG
jgi:uncharacterized protein YndB with AHSA1/START domain